MSLGSAVRGSVVPGSVVPGSVVRRSLVRGSVLRGLLACRSLARGVSRTPALLLLFVIRAWQLVVSPWYGPTCRFYPSCTSYGIEALRTHGALRGVGLAGWRLLRCNPWNPGGVDPVPLRGGSAGPMSGACSNDAHRSAVVLPERVELPERRGA